MRVQWIGFRMHLHFSDPALLFSKFLNFYILYWHRDWTFISPNNSTVINTRIAIISATSFDHKEPTWKPHNGSAVKSLHLPLKPLYFTIYVVQYGPYTVFSSGIRTYKSNCWLDNCCRHQPHRLPLTLRKSFRVIHFTVVHHHRISLCTNAAQDDLLMYKMLQKHSSTWPAYVFLKTGQVMS